MLTYDLTARGRKTMYEYLYEAMKADILSGRLTAGEKLPSKRAFAEHFQTVDKIPSLFLRPDIALQQQLFIGILHGLDTDL